MLTRHDVTDAFIAQLASETAEQAAERGRADYAAGRGLLDNPYSFCTPTNRDAYKAWSKAFRKELKRT